MTRTTGCLPLCPENVLSQRLEIMWYKCVGNCSEGRNFEGVLSRSSKLEYKKQQQARGFSLSCEILLEAHLSMLLSTGYNIFIWYIVKMYILYIL